MSEAGRSAGVEAARLIALANAHDERAALTRAEAERWMIGHRTERQVAGTLAPLTACGYTFLHDRGWPGARRGSRAQIDHVLVGPGGVFVVDTKSWKDVTVAGGRVYQGQDDVTERLEGIADVGVSTEAALVELGLAPGEVPVVVVLAGSAMDPVPLASLGGLVVVGEHRASKFINGFGRRLTERQQNAVLGAVMQHFPVLGDEPMPLDLSVPEPMVDEPVLLTVEEVADTFLAGMLAAPIEEWMAFLHPSASRHGPLAEWRRAIAKLLEEIFGVKNDRIVQLSVASTQGDACRGLAELVGRRQDKWRLVGSVILNDTVLIWSRPKFTVRSRIG